VGFAGFDPRDGGNPDAQMGERVIRSLAAPGNGGGVGPARADDHRSLDLIRRFHQPAVAHPG